jgi:hypothetical protein
MLFVGQLVSRQVITDSSPAVGFRVSVMSLAKRVVRWSSRIWRPGSVAPGRGASTLGLWRLIRRSAM